MIKAVMGGGGKGMRAVATPSEFAPALESARRESIGAFGDDRMILERLIQEPRHIEVQVFADMHGNAVYLFERDCSVQRRHQKVLEEAPAPGVNEDFRRAIGESAVDAAKAVGYVGAGTVEFIVDNTTGEYFFMEMNTRLQVEHPVTEMVTGTDLVAWQLHVAQGGVLPKQQDELSLRGHSIEARLYAENPDRGFLPSTGRLERWSLPGADASGLASVDVRSDTGYGTGDTVSPHYDAMLAKLIVWGADRDEALLRLRRALRETHIAGPSTNVDYLRRILRTDAFTEGGVTTAFIEEHADALKRPSTADFVGTSAASRCHPAGLAAAAVHLSQVRHIASEAHGAWAARGAAPFTVGGDWSGRFALAPRGASSEEMDDQCSVRISTSSRSHHVRIDVSGGGSLASTASDNDSAVDSTRSASSLLLSAELVDDSNAEGGICMRIVAEDGAVFLLPFVVYDAPSGNGDINVHVWDGEHEHEFVYSRWPATGVGSAADGSRVGLVRSPMPGKVVTVAVAEGDAVEEGDVLLVLEAMKMEHTLKATVRGTVQSMSAVVGDQVADGALLATVVGDGEKDKEITSKK